MKSHWNNLCERLATYGDLISKLFDKIRNEVIRKGLKIYIIAERNYRIMRKMGMGNWELMQTLFHKSTNSIQSEGGIVDDRGGDQSSWCRIKTGSHLNPWNVSLLLLLLLMVMMIYARLPNPSDLNGDICMNMRYRKTLKPKLNQTTNQITSWFRWSLSFKEKRRHKIGNWTRHLMFWLLY